MHTCPRAVPLLVLLCSVCGITVLCVLCALRVWRTHLPGSAAGGGGEGGEGVGQECALSAAQVVGQEDAHGRGEEREGEVESTSEGCRVLRKEGRKGMGGEKGELEMPTRKTLVDEEKSGKGK